MSARTNWLPFAALTLAATVALLIAGAQRMDVRTFALGSPNQAQVALLARGQQVCEGPITSPAAVGEVRIWGSAVPGTAQLTVRVDNASSGAVLAVGSIATGDAPNEYTATLRTPAPPERPLLICVVGQGPSQFSLLGSAPVRPDVVMTTSRGPQQAEFSLVLFGAARPSFLGALGTAFSRAALFRPSWVGTWTFWVLTAGLLATIVLGALAIAAAASADAD